MVNSTAVNPWVIARGSVIGRGHIAKGLPCQDANEVKLLSDYPGWGVAVVSDGAGSCENSHLGSTQVAKTSATLFTNLLIDKGWAKGNAFPTQEEWTLQAHLTFKTVTEDLRDYAAREKIDFHSLGATVIVVIFGPSALLVAHIGDGRGAGQRIDGTWQSILTPFKGEEANVTVFITSNIWQEDRINNYIGTAIYTEPFRAFAIMSDGCEMATFSLTRYDEDTQRFESLNEPYAPFFDPNVATLLTLNKNGRTEEEINVLWQKLLDSGNKRLADEPDDKTMILAVNQSLEILTPIDKIPTIKIEKDLSLCKVVIKNSKIKTKDRRNSRRKKKLQLNKGIN